MLTITCMERVQFLLEIIFKGLSKLNLHEHKRSLVLHDMLV